MVACGSRTGHSSLIFGWNPRIQFRHEAAMEAKAGFGASPLWKGGSERKPLAGKTTQPAAAETWR